MDDNGVSQAQKGNFAKKTLSSLAGDDDTFFVILDDRTDVWLVDKIVTDSDGREKLVKVQCANQLPIFPYQYWAPMPYLLKDGLNSCMHEAASKKDLDISLPLAA